MKRQITKIILFLAASSLTAVLAHAQTPATQPTSPVDSAIDRGLNYLKTTQKPDGSWENAGDPPAITALALKAFMGEKKYDADQPFLEKGYDKLLSYQKEDGGIYRDLLANYNTAIAVSSLAASQEAEYKPQIAKAVSFLHHLQWTDQDNGAPERQKVSANDPRYGGFGYGKKQRPDGSNVQIALDALHDAGIPKDDPAYAAAIQFISRTQNRSESNDQPWAGNDGGFIYSTADNGSSFAGEYTSPDGKRLLRSYGSMTYAGLKSMIYAGVAKDDPRVTAAFDWISKNWTLDINPGMQLANPAQAQHGLYYYYNVFAQALNVMDQPIVTDVKGMKHDWRTELVAKLASLQKPDGSWIGDKRWMEDDPILVTAYAVLALEQVKGDLASVGARPASP